VTKPLHDDPNVITPAQREEILALGHEHIHQRGCEFIGNWPTFRCAQCNEVSVGGENFRLGPSKDDPEKMVLYLGCANAECRAVYHAQIQMMQVGEWMTPEQLAAEESESEGATKQ
jgi:hypothetical protein